MLIPRKFTEFLILMRFHRPIGTFLLLWPTLIALWVAYDGMPPLPNLIIFVCGVIVMRALGCVINDLYDQKFDSHVKRTRERPLVRGTISRVEATRLCVVLTLMALFLASFLSGYALYCASLGFLLALLYPLMKRVFRLPQLWLGIAFAWPVMVVFADSIQTLNLKAWWFFCIVVLWTLAFDTAYALSDREDDKRLNLHSSAITFGSSTHLWIATFLSSAFLMYFLFGFSHKWSAAFYVICAACSFLIGWQIVLTFYGDPKKSFQAFRLNGWLGMLWFLGVVIK